MRFDEALALISLFLLSPGIFNLRGLLNTAACDYRVNKCDVLWCDKIIVCTGLSPRARYDVTVTFSEQMKKTSRCGKPASIASRTAASVGFRITAQPSCGDILKGTTTKDTGHTNERHRVIIDLSLRHLLLLVAVLSLHLRTNTRS
jgi:hypothetical protein